MIGLEQPIKWCSAYIYGHIVFGPTSCMITSCPMREALAKDVIFQSRLQRIARVGCSEPPIRVTSAMNADLFVPDPQRTAVDFGKLQDSAAHFDQIAEDCGRTNRYISTL